LKSQKGRAENKSAEVNGERVHLNHLLVYPNPFSERVHFEFVPAEAVYARIDMFDVTGRLVKTIINQPVQAGVVYNAAFKPDGAVRSFYLYRMTLGGSIQTGKVIYRE
jgi:hypothetical protein